MSLYFWVITLSFIGPFLLSFDKKIAFYKNWRFLLPSILLVALFFICWDEWFTKIGIWGFTPKYLQGIYAGHLPLEEILFFIVIPYNCLFVHEVLKGYFPLISLKTFSFVFIYVFGISALLYFISNCTCIWFNTFSSATKKNMVLTICFDLHSLPNSLSCRKRHIDRPIH